MDLWIRSTMGTNLTKCNCLSYIKGSEIYKKSDVEYNQYIICQCWDNGNRTPLGAYNSLERVLEILDEIQNLLFTRVMCKSDTTDDEANLLFCKESQGKLIPDTMLYAKPINLNSIVYQMPDK